MIMKNTLIAILFTTTIGLTGCLKSPPDTYVNKVVKNQPVVVTYKGVVTGVDNDNASFSHGKMAFVLDNKHIFGSPNLYDKDLGHSWTKGPAGMMGLSARLESAQYSKENVSVRGIEMPDGAYRIVEVTFSDSVVYKVKSNNLK